MKVVRDEDGVHSGFFSQLGLGHQCGRAVFFTRQKCSDFGHANLPWSVSLPFPSSVPSKPIERVKCVQPYQRR